jgi:tryptophan 2,3-dioxygenase
MLSTMTPADYMAFRAALDTSSGFQSFQFRELEFVLGNRNGLPGAVPLRARALRPPRRCLKRPVRSSIGAVL